MANSAEKISVYNLADLKNTSDDAIPNYLNSLKFKQSHFLTDVRLVLGYSAFALATACFFWDYKLGFQNTKHFTAVAVAVYTLINTALTLWITVKEKGIVYEGTAPSGETISISTSTKKNVPIYNLTVTVTTKDSKKQAIKIAKPFSAWFDQIGQFVAVPFQEMLASSVPLIGKGDPKRVTVSQELLDANPDVLDAILAANAATAVGSSTAAEVANKQGGKRRKA
ncbi:microsomal signal peptidase 25 kDa subunit-domain-containing protein [Dactylonectria estremocensis]|uniref:Signal peptidase complex subunit 2 n=1 Tax=Dactylonectria estremocensis TaxID=1079267 RepID=A0A9P9JC36_9HYPO|nr:microsomal signal peptidase 25 kDa subunit-domain-containing protein [Dactylonectria estremocensis]